LDTAARLSSILDPGWPIPELPDNWANVPTYG
jgi:hypothetical protein